MALYRDHAGGEELNSAEEIAVHNVSNNVVILTKDELSAKLRAEYDRGRGDGARATDPSIEEELFRLTEALLLCDHAASGSSVSWAGSAYSMPDSGGTDLGDRVNRVGEITSAVLGNISVAFGAAERYYRDHPMVEVRSWFGRLVREKQLGIRDPSNGKVLGTPLKIERLKPARQ